MSEIKVNKISPRTACGTTTLGDSGDSFVIPSGVTITNNGTQTGFGRTGTVDWQTSSIKTTTFTAANGEGYFADTSSGGFTMNLPAGTAGNIVSVVDYTNTFSTGNLTITPNGSQKIGGIAASFVASTNGQSLTFVYVDDTEGWKNVQDSTSNATGNPFLVASGGTESTCGNDKIHTFTGPGTFTVSAASVNCAAENIVSYLVIAGGGGGGGSDRGGGGGAGGFRELKSPTTPYTASPLDGYPSSPNRVTVTAQAYPITVGAGGSANSGNGGTSTFSTISAAGGGHGSYNCGAPAPTASAEDGGSGGGGAGGSPNGASGNTPPVTPSQGNNGGTGQAITSPARSSGGGGGGAGGTGANGSVNTGAAGGAGIATSITGSPVTRGGGGGGHSYQSTSGPIAGGAGGSGGGGAGGPWDGCNSSTPAKAGTAGTANTGGGGGGGGAYSGGGAAGGSGIVVIRYKFK
jgi:hypothetical protein